MSDNYRMRGFYNLLENNKLVLKNGSEVHFDTKEKKDKLKSAEDPCSHIWETVYKQNRIKDYEPPGFFKNGYITQEMIFLQECSKCGLLNKIIRVAHSLFFHLQYNLHKGPCEDLSL